MSAEQGRGFPLDATAKSCLFTCHAPGNKAD